MKSNDIKKYNRIVAYKKVFSTKDGHKVLMHLAKKCNVFSGTFVQGDPHMTSYLEGQRSVLNEILFNLNYTEKKLAQLLEEAQAFEKEENDE